MKINPTMGELSGSLGGITASRNAYGAYLKRKVSPVQPETPLQTLQRDRLADFSKQWTNVLTPVQREGWIGLSNRVTFPDVFGNPQKFAGNILFNKLNLNRATVGAPVLLDAPLNLNVRPLTAAEVVGANAGGVEIELEFAANCTADEKLVVRAVPNVNNGVEFVENQYRLMAVSAVSQASPWLVPYPAEWAAMIAGAKIVVRVQRVNLLNGAYSPGTKSEFVIGPPLP